MVWNKQAHQGEQEEQDSKGYQARYGKRTSNRHAQGRDSFDFGIPTFKPSPSNQPCKGNDEDLPNANNASRPHQYHNGREDGYGGAWAVGTEAGRHTPYRLSDYRDRDNHQPMQHP